MALEPEVYTMSWDPTNFTDTALLSITGGVIAGIVVILLEWSFRFLYGWRQRRSAIHAVREFFRRWEDDINSTEDMLTSDCRFSLPKTQLQYVKHKDFLRRVRILLDRWSKFLSEKQTEDVALLLGDHEGGTMSIIPEDSVPGQNFYDVFFRDARTIEWLEF